MREVIHDQEKDPAGYVLLRQFGFSKTAVACYENLFELGPVPVVDLAKRLGQSPTNLYRVLRRLETQGFVTSVKADLQPTYFSAERLDRTLHHYYDYQRLSLAPLIRHQKAILSRRSGRPVL